MKKIKKATMESKIMQQLGLRRPDENVTSGDWSSKIQGDVSKIQGDASGIRGDVSRIQGDVSGIKGSTSEILNILKKKAER